MYDYVNKYQTTSGANMNFMQLYEPNLSERITDMKWPSIY